MSTVKDNFGIDDKIIENLNLIETWQHVIKVHFLEGDSRECLVGDEWWFLVIDGSR